MKNETDIPAFAPGLYLVATPIGNLRDITLRALDLLAAADVVLCEDSRVTGKLLHAYSLKKTMHVYNDHSDARQRDAVLDMLAQGKIVALVSDAGTPLISDPGYKLVREALERGLTVTALPGANAPLTALQLSGLPSDAFSFIGFLPPKTEARKKKIAEWAHIPGTLVLFETGPRLAASLADLRSILGDRQAAVTRELTKMYEESRRGTFSGLLRSVEETGAPKGEIVVVIAAGEKADAAPDLDAVLRDLLRDMSVRDAAAAAAFQTGLPKKQVYERALFLAKDDDES